MPIWQRTIHPQVFPWPTTL